MRTIDEQLRDRLQEVGEWQPTELRHAAVLCPIVTRYGRDHMVFVMRPHGDHQHAGQLAFPGGMRDGDETVLETALRETNEEVGAAEHHLEVLGGVAPRVSSSRILVHCVAARLQPMALVAEPREVERILEIPLDELLDEDRWQDKPPPPPYPQGDGQRRWISPHFTHQSDLLWGLTARFVRDITAHVGTMQ